MITMKNPLAIMAFEKMLSNMIFGVLPVVENHQDLMAYLMEDTAEQLHHIIEEDGHYTMENVVDACEELAIEFGKYD